MEEQRKKEIIQSYTVSNNWLDTTGKDIAKRAVNNLSTHTNPTIIFTGGQPGSGKSTIADQQKARFKDDIAIVDADKYRHFHPKNDEIKSKYPSIASNSTHQAGAAIGNRVRDAAFNKNANILFDQTSRTPDGIKGIAKRVKDNNLNYKLELHVIAVDLDTSRSRVHSRLEEGGGVLNGGRYVDEDFQNVSTKGLDKTLKVIEDEKIVNRIVIYDKYGQSLYDNSLNNGEWVKAPKAHETFIKERERSLSRTEKLDLTQTWQKVQFKMSERNASKTEPGIYKTAIDGIKKAEANHNLKIKPPELAKAGRSYSGVLAVVNDKNTLQLQHTGRAYIHDTNSLGIDDKKQYSNAKITYDNSNKAKVTFTNNRNTKEKTKDIVKNLEQNIIEK